MKRHNMTNPRRAQVQYIQDLRSRQCCREMSKLADVEAKFNPDGIFDEDGNCSIAFSTDRAGDGMKGDLCIIRLFHPTICLLTYFDQ